MSSKTFRVTYSRTVWSCSSSWWQATRSPPLQRPADARSRRGRPCELRPMRIRAVSRRFSRPRRDARRACGNSRIANIYRPNRNRSCWTRRDRARRYWTDCSQSAAARQQLRTGTGRANCRRGTCGRKLAKGTWCRPSASRTGVGVCRAMISKLRRRNNCYRNVKLALKGISSQFSRHCGRWSTNFYGR